MMKLRWPQFDFQRPLGAAEVAELAARIAELSRAGMPLGDGLRAMAGDLPGRRLPRTLRRLADRFDAGDDLKTSLESQGRRLPGHLVGLMLAGVRSGRLAQVLEEFVELERSRWELRRRVWLALAYPLLLSVMLAALMLFCSIFVVSQFRPLFADFKMDLPIVTQFFFESVRPGAWVVMGFAAGCVAVPVLLQFTPAPAWLPPLLYAIPLIGPLLRWSRLAQFARLMAVLLEQQVPLPEALRLTAAGLGDAYLARGCREAAGDVEAGRLFWESLAEKRQFPPSLIPLVRWGQLTPALADAFRAAAEMFEGRVVSQEPLLDAVLLPVALLVITAFIGSFILAVSLPTIALIQKLS
jgi:general secretion pathway protein F